MQRHESDEIVRQLRLHYGQIAIQHGRMDNDASSCCCPSAALVQIAPQRLGYAVSDLTTAPAGSNLGLGCGNPCAFAALQPGETVLDLGSGAGVDCFLAAQAVGAAGFVIGIDMTPEMVARAEKNRKEYGYTNVAFHLARIEHLPVASASIDVTLSNCVINLSAEKERVYREIYRVLKPGGRIAIADIVAKKPLPDHLRADRSLYNC